MTQYKVTNLTKDTRKFRNNRLGNEVLVGSKQVVITENPPKESDVWKIEIHAEKTEEKKPLKGGKQEMKKIKHKMLDRE